MSLNNTDSAVVSTFVTDPLGGVNDPDEIFIGGGSKDDLDICEPNLTDCTNGVAGATIGPWLHETGNVPDKDNIEHAYAAAYNCDDFPTGGGFGDPNNDPGPLSLFRTRPLRQ